MAWQLAGAPADRVTDQHLSGCLECSACHDVCPTGVPVADLRRAQRNLHDPVDPLRLEERLGELAPLIARDAGAVLAADALRRLVQSEAPTDRSAGPRSGGVLLLPGKLLELVRPDIDARLRRWEAATPARLVRDPALATALDRASGLLSDFGLATEHDAALAEVCAIFARRGYQDLTVVAIDRAILRLGCQPLPAGVRVTPATDLAPSAQPSDAAEVWDGPAQDPFRPVNLEALEEGADPAGAPVLLQRAALEGLQRLLESKRARVGGRRLVTADARTLVRFPGSRHVLDGVGRQPPLEVAR